MGFVTMGIFTLNPQGIQGAVFLMVSHGFVSAALFLCVGVIYDRMHSREIATYGGLVNRMPWYAVAFLIFTLANIGLPGTSGFIGEFLTLLGAWKTNTWIAFLASFGLILSACYALWLIARVMNGKLEKPSLAGILDLDLRERLVLAPLVVVTIFYGFYPKPILGASEASVQALVVKAQAAIAAGGKIALIVGAN
jgi:NADH-quinone oxidoreductase subunit M